MPSRAFLFKLITTLTLPVDALTEAVAELHIEAVFVLAAVNPSAVFLYAFDSYMKINVTKFIKHN